MRKKDTAAGVLVGALLLAIPVIGQVYPVVPAAVTSRMDWRRVGNASIDGFASGPVDRVWFTEGEQGVAIRTASGRVFRMTADTERWIPFAAIAPPAAPDAAVRNLPEPGAHTRRAFGDSRVYAFGEHVYRSDDGGLHWENKSALHGVSLLGGRIRDLVISSNDPDAIAVASDSGVFHSVDGGRSWASWNGDLPNLPVARLLDLPGGTEGVRIELANHGVVTWPPGEKQGWRDANNADVVLDIALRAALGTSSGDTVTATISSGDYVYVGSASGEIRASADRGLTWRTFLPAGAGRVERFWLDEGHPGVAMAVLGAGSASLFQTGAPVHVLRTGNGGAFWDNMTGNLPDAAAHGIAADASTGAVYAATDRGVFMTFAGGDGQWMALGGLPIAPAMDVKLDAQGHQLWAAVDGFGVYAALAPHRLLDPKVVGAADLVARAAAPGSLITVLGAQLDSATAGNANAPLLAVDGAQSQVQIPFDARGNSVALMMTESSGSQRREALALLPAAPAIFTGLDGAPMLLDADSGLMLDAMTPARSGSRMQILAAGLGRVKPEWPAGVAAPLENSPQVAGSVHVYLDREPVEVTRAILAPGYVGFYLVEIEVPKIVNYGPAELYLDVDGSRSNSVRVYIEP